MTLLFYGFIGPLFIIMYFLSDRDPFMNWFFWSGLVVTIAIVLTAVAITVSREKSDEKLAALEQDGVLALARIVGIHETGTQINDRPLVRIDLQISGRGVQPFSSQDRVIASLERQSLINNRKLVVLVDPATNKYQIDWDRTALVSGVTPAKFTIDEDNRTYDLSGQVEPLMEILGILMANGIGWKDMGALRSNPAAREQVRAVVRRAAGQSAPATPAAAVPNEVPPETSIGQRLQQLETLRVSGSISEDEYATKRGQIIAEL